MHRELIENVYRAYVWQIARVFGNKDLKNTLRVQLQLDPDFKQELRLTLSKTNFNGMRLWFLCPGCGRRVGAIYCLPTSWSFACRHCHGLRYEVQTRHRDRFYESVDRPIKKLKALEGRISGTIRAQGSNKI